LRAKGPTPAASPLDELRLDAVVADHASRGVLRLEDVWRELCSGHYTVEDNFLTSSRCLFVLRASPLPIPLPAMRRRVLEAVLSGVGQKVVSIDFGLAPSTIAAHARAALVQLGFRSRPGHVSPLLMLAAKAAREPTAKTLARVSLLTRGEDTLWVIGAPRPDAILTLIPPAEQDVLRRLVEGCAYDEIASQRGRSVRTVANQLAAVFRRLGVSGRAELILMLYGLQPMPSS
jgi:DNA-binding NarL/FixJ family response regulator